MSIHSCARNSNFILSNNTYADDYSFCEKYPIDMTLSGSFLLERELSVDFSKISLDKYPPVNLECGLISELAKNYNIDEKNIILGSGANGIFQNLIKILIQKNKNLVVPYFSFAQPEYATISLKGVVRRVFCKTDYHIDFDRLRCSINSKTGAVFLCNPNNPTGLYEEPSIIVEFARSVNIPVIVSESNIEFSLKKSLFNFKCPNNLIVVRSFSKAHGLAGIRLGYAMMQEPYKSMYLENTTRFEISTISLYLAIESLKGKIYKENIQKVILERDFLRIKLKEIGISMLPSFSNTLMSLDSYPISFYEGLNKKGVSVVLVPDPDNNTHFRIAIQKPPINQLFFNKVKEQYYETFISNKF